MALRPPPDRPDRGALAIYGVPVLLFPSAGGDAEEVIPAIHSDSGGPVPVVVAGASIGAFNSLTMICRYPHLVDSAICMSGTFSIEKSIGGRFTDDLYCSSPLHFLPGLDGPTLDLLP